MLLRMSSVPRVTPTRTYTRRIITGMPLARSTVSFASIPGTERDRRNSALALCQHRSRGSMVVRYASTSTSATSGDGRVFKSSPTLASSVRSNELLQPRPEPPRGATSPFSRVAISKLSSEEAEAELAYLSQALLYHDWVIRV